MDTMANTIRPRQRPQITITQPGTRTTPRIVNPGRHTPHQSPQANIAKQARRCPAIHQGPCVRPHSHGPLPKRPDPNVAHTDQHPRPRARDTRWRRRPAGRDERRRLDPRATSQRRSWPARDEKHRSESRTYLTKTQHKTKKHRQRPRAGAAFHNSQIKDDLDQTNTRIASRSPTSKNRKRGTRPENADEGHKPAPHFTNHKPRMALAGRGRGSRPEAQRRSHKRRADDREAERAPRAGAAFHKSQIKDASRRTEAGIAGEAQRRRPGAGGPRRRGGTKDTGRRRISQFTNQR